MESLLLTIYIFILFTNILISLYILQGTACVLEPWCWVPGPASTTTNGYSSTLGIYKYFNSEFIFKKEEKNLLRKLNSEQ